MSKKPKIDKEILAILDDYNLFLESDKEVDMPFRVNHVDLNHATSLKGVSALVADAPLGETVLECEMREKSEINYSFKILSDAVKSRMLFRLDEGDGTHWNRHLNIPVDQQQVLTPHFHKKGDDGIEYAYRTNRLEEESNPLNIHDGFAVFCEECHINQDNIQLEIHEEGTMALDFKVEVDPLKNIIFP